MDNNLKPDRRCAKSQGSLPAPCAPLAFPYVPAQCNDPARYSKEEALAAGTLFPGLDLPFKCHMQKRNVTNTALAELMALDFAVDELGLYLTTHPDDSEVLSLYWSYIALAKEGRKKYQELYGPLRQTDVTKDGYVWLKDPWPWDEGGSK